jgi:hypothetical protein
VVGKILDNVFFFGGGVKKGKRKRETAKEKERSKKEKWKTERKRFKLMGKWGRIRQNINVGSGKISFFTGVCFFSDPWIRDNT